MRWIFGFLAAWGLFVMNGAPASAQCYGPGPCGPPGLEWMFPQGFAGADFRYACARHDMCYTYGAFGGRRACDQQFYRDMNAACHYSRFPLMCRIQASTMFMGTRLFGAPAYGSRW